MKIAVAGASGFVGQHLIQKLVQEGHQVVALSRASKESQHKNVTWRRCDLFSRLDIIDAISDCDVAFYLVHSMLPSARMTQGKFWDYDLVLADNYARAAKSVSLSQIIYLGGIIPEDMDLSRHLLSRFEVERTLRNSGVPFTSLRAGIILGPLSSSFRMMHRLVKHLPVMICPSWTETLSNPIHIDDVVAALMFCVGNETVYQKIFDIGGATTISYVGMMKMLAEKMNLRRKFVSFPFFTPGLSKLWVSVITGAPKDLVYPLIGSLKTHMVPNVQRRLVVPGRTTKRIEDAFDEILANHEALAQQPKAFEKPRAQKADSKVRSIQRLETMYRFNAKEVADQYFDWIIDKYAPIIPVTKEGARVVFRAIGLRVPLLVLEYGSTISTCEHQVYYIKGGILARTEGRGRLSFRSIIDHRYTMGEIHEFTPRLPWYIYKYSQALWHLHVMRSFNAHLLHIQKEIGNDAYETTVE